MPKSTQQINGTARAGHLGISTTTRHASQLTGALGPHGGTPLSLCAGQGSRIRAAEGLPRDGGAERQFDGLTLKTPPHTWLALPQVC